MNILRWIWWFDEGAIAYKSWKTTGNIDMKNCFGENCICGIILDLERAVKKMKETIVLKFNNKNFLILSRSFVLRSFRFVWNNIDSIFHSYVQRKTFFSTNPDFFVIPQIWYDSAVSKKFTSILNFPQLNEKKFHLA